MYNAVLGHLLMLANKMSCSY